MIVKIFKVVWFISLLSSLAVFFYVYASLPENISLSDGGRACAISREAFFYLMLLLLAVFNGLVVLISRLSLKSEKFATWYFGLTITLNIFFTSTLIFLNIFNSAEKYNYASVGPTVYGSILLMIFWMASWPVYVMIAKIRRKTVI